MATTNEQSGAEVLSTVSGVLLKADVLGRVTLGREQRETMLDAFEASGMSVNGVSSIRVNQELFSTFFTVGLWA